MIVYNRRFDHFGSMISKDSSIGGPDYSPAPSTSTDTSPIYSPAPSPATSTVVAGAAIGFAPTAPTILVAMPSGKIISTSTPDPVSTDSNPDNFVRVTSSTTSVSQAISTQMPSTSSSDSSDGKNKALYLVGGISVAIALAIYFWD